MQSISEIEKNPFYKYLTVEDVEHLKVVNFLKSDFPDVVAFHVPNSSKKKPFDLFKHSIMGILKGICDFIILHPKYKTIFENDKSKKILVYHGLAIELKAPEHNVIIKKGKNEGKIRKAIGKLSPEQKEIIEKLNKVRYKAVCCFGSDEAIKVIKEYLSIQ